MTQVRPTRAQGGFTLIELMIALLLFSFAIAGILSVAVTTTRSFREQRRIIQTEQAVRAPLDFIVDAIRQASPGVPTIASGAVVSLRNSFMPCPGPGAISFVDNTAAADELEIVYASGGVVTTAHSVVDNTSTEVTIPSAHIDQFAAGDFVVISDGANGTLLRVTGIQGNNLQIARDQANCGGATEGFPAPYVLGSLIVRAQRARFTVERFDGDPNQPWTLYMDPDGGGPLAKEPIAEGVEDMQIAIGVDSNNDNIISEVGQVAGDDEWIGNVAGEVMPLGTIRAVRIVLIAYDVKDVTGQASFYRPSALNRPGTLTPEKRRRRVLMSTVEMRNLSELP